MGTSYEESVRARAWAKLDAAPVDDFQLLCRVIRLYDQADALARRLGAPEPGEDRVRPKLELVQGGREAD